MVSESSDLLLGPQGTCYQEKREHYRKEVTPWQTEKARVNQCWYPMKRAGVTIQFLAYAGIAGSVCPEPRGLPDSSDARWPMGDEIRDSSQRKVTNLVVIFAVETARRNQHQIRDRFADRNLLADLEESRHRFA